MVISWLIAKILCVKDNKGMLFGVASCRHSISGTVTDSERYNFKDCTVFAVFP